MRAPRGRPRSGMGVGAMSARRWSSAIECVVKLWASGGRVAFLLVGLHNVVATISAQHAVRRWTGRMCRGATVAGSAPSVSWERPVLRSFGPSQNKVWNVAALHLAGGRAAACVVKGAVEPIVNGISVRVDGRPGRHPVGSCPAVRIGRTDVCADGACIRIAVWSDGMRSRDGRRGGTWRRAGTRRARGGALRSCRPELGVGSAVPTGGPR